MIHQLQRDMLHTRNDKGFTLIELLVVIAIIGILAAIIIVALGSTRPRARDSRRKADLNNARTAVTAWLTSDERNTLTCSDCVASGDLGPALTAMRVTTPPPTNVIPTFLSSSPVEPVAGGPTYRYFRVSADSFAIGAGLEIQPSAGDPGVAACAGTGISFSAPRFAWCIRN